MEQASAAALPVILCVILLFGFFRGVDVFDAFLAGAKEGLRTTLGILPTLIGLMLAVAVVRDSGLLDILCGLARPLAEAVGVQPELLPLAVLRPISGSGSSAYTLSLLEEFGPDSGAGRMASVLAASTETTFYAITVYFGSCGIKKLSYSVPAGLLGDAAALAFTVLTVQLFS